MQVVLDIRGFVSPGEIINWTLLAHLAKSAAHALAVDDAPTASSKASPGASTAKAAAVASSATLTSDEKRLAGLVSFALAAAVPDPSAALALGRARAGVGKGTPAGTALGSGGKGGGAGSGDVRTELLGMLSGVQLVRRGLAERLLARPRAAVAAATGGAAGAGSAGGRGGAGRPGVFVGGGGGREARIDVKQFVVRCPMTQAQDEVYSTIAR